MNRAYWLLFVVFCSRLFATDDNVEGHITNDKRSIYLYFYKSQKDHSAYFPVQTAYFLIKGQKDENKDVYYGDISVQYYPLPEIKIKKIIYNPRFSIFLSKQNEQYGDCDSHKEQEEAIRTMIEWIYNQKLDFNYIDTIASGEWQKDLFKKVGFSEETSMGGNSLALYKSMNTKE